MANISSKSSSAGLEDQRQEILSILHQLAEDLARVYFLPGYPNCAKKMEELTLVRTRDLEGVMSILSDLNTPLIISFAGGSSCGKSTLFNTIAGEVASAVSLLRPTTSIPILYHHPTRTGYFNRKDFMEQYEKVVSQDLVPPGSSRGRPKTFPKKIILYPSQQPDYPEDFALLDTPDIDTTEAQNKEMAHDLFHIASLILFVFSAEKYADHRLWEDARYLRNLGKPLAFVLNKLTSEHKTEGLVDDFEKYLREKGFDFLGAKELKTENRWLTLSLKSQASVVFYIDKEQPETENYPQQLSQEVKDQFYEFFHTLLNPAEKRALRFQLVSQSLRHLTERLENLIDLLQGQQKELLNLEAQIEKHFLLAIDIMIQEIRHVGGLDNRAVLNLIRENLASLIGFLNLSLLRGARVIWQWLANIFGKEEKTFERSKDAIEHFIQGDFDKKFNILVSKLGDVEDHIQQVLKKSYIGSTLEMESHRGNGRLEEWETRSIQTLYYQEVIQFKKWLEGEVQLKTQNLRKAGTVWINLIDSVILILILLLFAYVGVKGGAITGEEAIAAAGISWVWDWLVTKFWGKEELKRFMVAGEEKYLAIFKNVIVKQKEKYLEFIQKYQKNLEGINQLIDRVDLLKPKLTLFIEQLEVKNSFQAPRGNEEKSKE